MTESYAIAKSVAQADRLIQMALDALCNGGTRTDAIIYLNDARAHNAVVLSKLLNDSKRIPKPAIGDYGVNLAVGEKP